MAKLTNQETDLLKRLNLEIIGIRADQGLKPIPEKVKELKKHYSNSKTQKVDRDIIELVLYRIGELS